jgi:hypothetical protein
MSSRRVGLLIVCVLLGALTSPGPVHAFAAPAATIGTPARYSFSIDGHEVGTFTRLVSASTSVQPGIKGGDKATVVLRRPATSSIEFSAWNELAKVDLAGAKKEVVITARASDGDALMKFKLTDAFPTKVELTSEGQSPVMETVTMTGKFLQRMGV